MAVKMRLTRMGDKKAPFYRVVVADSRVARDAKYIDLVGTYNPIANPEEIKIDNAKAQDWIKKGAHITAVGACEPNMQELDPKILAMADIVCTDSIEACAKNGELQHALDMGYIEQDKVFELGEAITTKIQREPTDITVCDLVGIGFQDAVIASCVMGEYDRQRKHEDTHEIK